MFSTATPEEPNLSGWEQDRTMLAFSYSCSLILPSPRSAATLRTVASFSCLNFFLPQSGGALTTARDELAASPTCSTSRTTALVLRNPLTQVLSCCGSSRPAGAYATQAGRAPRCAPLWLSHIQPERPIAPTPRSVCRSILSRRRIGPSDVAFSQLRSAAPSRCPRPCPP
jgi:hypothetical protein